MTATAPAGSERAPRATARMALSLALFVLAPCSWWIAIDVPALRSSGLSVWILLAAALGLALGAVRRDERRWVRVAAGLEVALAALFAWAWFGLQRLPATHEPERAPDFTLPDQDGHPITLSAELARGPVVLVFFRGHW